jgi:hypothetical protein
VINALQNPQAVSELGVDIRPFSVRRLAAAMDAERQRRGLSWRQAAAEIWEQSADLNATRDDHPIAASTLAGMGERGGVSCQHALFVLRWLGRSPESFLVGGEQADETYDLPQAGLDRRLRWDLAATYEAMNVQRLEQGLSWPELARLLRCSPNQLTGLRTARFAMGMQLAMKIVQWLETPATTFIHPATW